jgi:polysaccharide export outer membrane protein
MLRTWRGYTALILLLALWLQFGIPPILGQEERAPTGVAGTRSPRYYLSLGTEDALMIKVFIWGQVELPGVYEVPDGTDLIAALSLAGGPTDHAKLSEVKIIRSRASNSEVISVNVKKYMNTGDISLIPVLKPGDTVVVSGTVFRMFARFASFVSQLAIVANVIVLLSYRR